MKPGQIGQVLSEESSRIINGLGPAIGQLVRAIATYLSGAIIGFTYVIVYSFISQYYFVELVVDRFLFDVFSMYHIFCLVIRKSNGKVGRNDDDRPQGS